MCIMYSLPVQASQPMGETEEGNGQDCLCDDAANQRLIAGLLRALTSDSYESTIYNVSNSDDQSAFMIGTSGSDKRSFLRLEESLVCLELPYI